MTLQYVKPTEEQLEVMQNFRDQYEALMHNIISLETSQGVTTRGLALAKTKLEESAMWINKAITKND